MVAVEGDVAQARVALLEQPWVVQVGVNGGDVAARLRITVSGEGVAAARLQRVLLADEIWS
jgi:hypothetical protein